MISSINGYPSRSHSCSSCLTWKVNLEIALAINVDQGTVTFDVWTALETWFIAKIA